MAVLNKKQTNKSSRDNQHICIVHPLPTLTNNNTYICICIPGDTLNLHVIMIIDLRAKSVIIQ